MLWEENVPLMMQGYHKRLVQLAYGEEAKGVKVFPPRPHVFDAMRITGLGEVKVVVIGQDPYFNEHPGLGPEAHGLCFSVREGFPAPPSLKNIFLEINRSIYHGEQKKQSTDLTRWAKQGVLLLNASLTVKKKMPNSHARLGWHKLTDNIIETVSNKKEYVVFMLWGAFAQRKSIHINSAKHCILKTTHPSPLSAHKGFLGSGVFKKCNDYLQEHGKTPIKW